MGKRHYQAGPSPEMTKADRRAAARVALDPDDLERFWAADRDARDATYQAARDVKTRRWRMGLSTDRAWHRYWVMSNRTMPVPGLDTLRLLSETGPGPAPAEIVPFLAWLEEDPFARATGYEKQKILRLLRRFTFAEPEAAALRRIILAMIQRGPRQEFREVRRLARCVDSADFRADLARLAKSDRSGVAERARLTLGLCERRPLPA